MIGFRGDRRSTGLPSFRCNGYFRFSTDLLEALVNQDMIFIKE
ncbi:hypothetical protein [Tunicatimonas pelagia]|nr:hypothetical protein [Tunicatimonas pelagia]WKN43206.1 hypothetical protein P0M28_29625 [Tunicatimonas pelagia]